MNNTQYPNKNFALTNFTDQILEHAANTFSVMHNHFLKQIWGNNNITNKLHYNQVTFDPANGRYEVYIPTRDSVTNNLEYMRIAIQILPMVSNDTKHLDAYKLAEPIKQPHGKIESEFLILIAPRQYKWGLVRGFKHRNKPGYFTGVFVNASPDIIWKRVLDQLINFFGKRLDGLFDSLGFERWVWKWLQQKDTNLLYYSRILERFSYVIQQSAFTFLKVWQHFMDKIKLVLKEIGLQNVAKSHVKQLYSMKKPDLQRYFELVKKELQVGLFVSDGRLSVDELRVLQVVEHG